MRITLTTVLAGILAAGSPVCAQSPNGAPDVQPAPKVAAEARALLKEMAKAYRKAPTVNDQFTMEIISPLGREKEPGSVVLGKGDRSRFEVMGMIMTTLGGHLYLELDGASDKYLQRKVEGDIIQTAAKLSEGEAILPFHYLLRYGSVEEGGLDSFTMGMLSNARFDGVEQVEQADGSPAHDLSIKGDEGTARIRVDSKSKLVVHQMISVTPPDAPAGQGMQLVVTYKPKIAKKLESPITFQAGDREMVKSLEELMPSMPEEPQPQGSGAVGTPAHDFTLQTPGGETVALKDLRGQVVVLDFWATWCGWCIRAMPLLQEFHDWAAATGQPIKVFAVNCWERKSTEEVVEFWKGKGWTIPILLDKGDALVGKYGFRGIPATVVVGPDGNIANIHQGYSPEMIKMLKDDAAKALE
ncbi:MAG: TlpA family protein disulfide reductase [Phycisphaerales bacterium]|nr:MAG: TlpA family protein disulfide reductase [Phycisphaerales bacterium]